jgi:peroxiredoxin
VYAADSDTDRQLAPFSLKTSSGARFDSEAHRRKDVIVIAFWATWCKPCKIELVQLHKLFLKYREQGLIVLAVSIDGPDSVAEVENYKNKFSYEFPVLMDTETDLLARYNPRGDVPFSMVVDRSGRIVETHQGFNPGDEIALEKKLKRLLAEDAPITLTTKEGVDSDIPDYHWPEHAYWIKPDALRVEGTNTLRLQWLQDNGDANQLDNEVFGIVNRLTIGIATGGFSAGVRADAVAYPGYDPEERCAGETTLDRCQWDDDYRIERLYLRYKAPDLELRGGDFYHSIGRGIVFSVRKIDELGLDTALRGGMARGRVGPVQMMAFGGVSNIQNIDVIQLGRLAEVQDPLAGGEVKVDLPLDIQIAARGLWVDYRENPSDLNDEGDLVFGGSYEQKGIADILSIYFEGAWIRNKRTRTSLLSGAKSNRDADGHALYGNVSLNPAKGLTILFEGKDYRRYNISREESGLIIAYNEAPTLERFDQILQTRTNATGGRTLIEYYLDEAQLLLFANVLYYGYSLDSDWNYDEEVDNFDQEKAFGNFHAFGGFEVKWGRGYYVTVSGGWRLEAKHKTFSQAFTSDNPADFYRRLWHIESDIQIPLVGPHSIGLRTQHRSEEKPLTDSLNKEFFRGDIALTYAFAPKLSIGLLYTYETEIAKESNDRFINFAGEVTWRFADWGQLNIFGGRNTAGIICVSGVCRNLPSFYGVRAEFVARF